MPSDKTGRQVSIPRHGSLAFQSLYFSCPAAMPTWSVHAACIDLMLCHEAALLEFGAWSQMTHTELMPFRPGGIPEQWDQKTIDSVLALRDHLIALPEKEHLKFLRAGNKDNFSAGRAVLNQWLLKRVDNVWRIKQRVLECLEENELGPYDQIRAHCVEEVSRLHCDAPLLRTIHTVMCSYRPWRSAISLRPTTISSSRFSAKEVPREVWVAYRRTGQSIL